jgi:hypothetical protein
MKSLLTKIKKFVAGITAVLMFAWLVAPIGVYAATDVAVDTGSVVTPIVEVAPQVSAVVVSPLTINSGVTITSSNENPGYARVGDKITVKFSASDNLVSPTVNIFVDGVTFAEIDPLVVAPNYEATYVLKDTDTVEGNIQVKIDDSSLAAPVIETSSVIFDKTAPKLFSTYADYISSLAPALALPTLSDEGVYLFEATGEADVFTEWSVPTKNVDGSYAYKVTYSAKDIAGNVTEAGLVKDVVLSTGTVANPVIPNATVNLLGDTTKTTHAELGAIYKDAGANVQWVDATKPVYVWTEGTLNTAVANTIEVPTYNLTYQAADSTNYLALKSAVNPVTTNTRIIEVSDTTGPSPVKDFYLVTGNGFVDLHWINPTDADFAGVQIWRSLAAGEKGREIAFTASKTTNSFEDSDVVNGTTYYYQVIAVDNVSNQSTPSVQLSATPIAPVVASADTSFGNDGGYVAEPEVVKTTTNEVKGAENKDEKKIVVAWYNREFAGMKIWLWILILVFVLGVGYWYFTKEEQPKPKAAPKSKKKK